MPYASQQDFINAFGETELIQLTDLAGAGVVDADAFAAVQARGDGEIDGYLGGRYVLPLVLVPRNIVGYACDIYRYRLQKGVSPELVENNFKSAISYFVAVSTGRINLPPDATGTPTVDTDVVQMVGPRRTFNAQNLRRYTDDGDYPCR